MPYIWKDKGHVGHINALKYVSELLSHFQGSGQDTDDIYPSSEYQLNELISETHFEGILSWQGKQV